MALLGGAQAAQVISGKVWDINRSAVREGSIKVTGHCYSDSLPEREGREFGPVESNSSFPVLEFAAGDLERKRIRSPNLCGELERLGA